MDLLAGTNKAKIEKLKNRLQGLDKKANHLQININSKNDRGIRNMSSKVESS